MNKLYALCALIPFFGLMATSCTQSDEPIMPTPPSEVTNPGAETLAESLLGTYECRMSVVKGEQNYGDNLALYCFVTPVASKAADSIKIEIRRWSGSFMPHLLGFEAHLKVKKHEDGSVEMISKAGIPYFIEGMPGNDPKGTVSHGVFMWKENKPNFSCEFFILAYKMRVNSLERRTKTVLPNAISTL